MTTISANSGKVYGSLSLEDHTNPYRLDAFQDDYSLVDFTLGQTIELDLSSEEFDTYLQLINSDTGEIITENDDFNDSANSRLSFIPEENLNYLVRVTSYGSGKVGNYTLTADKPDVDLIIEDAEGIILTKKYFDDTYYPYDNEAFIYLDLSLTVKNLGSETIFVDSDNDDYYYYNSGLIDTVYLSSDEHFDPIEDYWLTEFWHDSNLEAGASYTNKSEASIYKLDIWGQEDNYLIFVADSSNYQYEANEDNNTFAIPLDLDLNRATPDVDLVITDATATVGTYNNYYGETSLDLSWTITNQGTETALGLPDDYDYYYEPNWYNEVYLSSDEHFDPAEDYYITNIWHEYSLAGGESYTDYSSAYLYDYDLEQTENNYLIFVADSSNYQYETNEDNNTYAIPLDLDLNRATPDVDLVITDATATVGPYNNYYGETSLDLSWTITNQGTETALGLPDDYDYYNEPNWYNEVYLSSDEHFDPAEDYYITNIWHEYSLAGGESYTDYSSAYLYDYNLDQTGNNYLIFVADSYNYQYETNEDNNTYAIPLDLTPPDVDLVATDASATVGSYDHYNGGAYLNFSLTVTNQGSDTINNFYGYDAVYVSSDEHFNDYEDYWVSDLGSDYYGNPLEAGASYTSESFGVYISGEQLHALESGELKLLFVSDPYNSYYETDKTNNSLVASLDNLLSTPIYRFQNHDLPGSYLYLGEEESKNIYSDYPNFAEEGMAFKVASKPHDDLAAMYRFQSKTAPGSYLYVGEGERHSVKQNYSDSFIEEGLCFYVYSAGSGKETTFYRFRNTNSDLNSSYIYAAGEEAEYIRNNLPVYVEEGAAFEAIL